MTHVERPGSPGRAEFMERHYTFTELAAAWHVSRSTLAEWFREEPGVIRYGTMKLKKGRRRTYVSVRVPESVARRVYKTRTGREI
jgi:hypothetical protein